MNNLERFISESDKTLPDSKKAGVEVGKPIYEPPKLMELGKVARGVGGCNVGSGASGKCKNGTLPTSRCTVGILPAF